MDHIVPISKARAILPQLLAEAAERPVFLLRHGETAGVLLDAAYYERLLSRIEALEDAASANPGKGRKATGRRRDRHQAGE